MWISCVFVFILTLQYFSVAKDIGDSSIGTIPLNDSMKQINGKYTGTDYHCY